MALYAMSDLHLSHCVNKPMDIFDPIWHNHTKKILTNWNEVVGADDTVIVNGDLSWGMTFDEVKPDLDFIHRLNGRKIFVQGNHDYFWNSTSRLNTLYDNMFFLKNNFTTYNDIAICGTRGWICPDDTKYTAHDKKIYEREVGRLRLSIREAVRMGYDGNNILVAMHYPPTNDKKQSSLFIDVLKEFDIKKIIYGHLHGASKYNNSLMGDIDGINYTLVSADYLNFKPIRIM